MIDRNINGIGLELKYRKFKNIDMIDRCNDREADQALKGLSIAKWKKNLNFSAAEKQGGSLSSFSMYPYC